MRPKPIVRLSPDVVNRVAAGEVIHRPASALKEMLENSLDAGSRSITVTVRDGGNKLLQVTDDGCGIRDEDLPILCERHTTSKLRTFEDLDAVATFGFRGEALASMSFVANLTVTTMTADAAHATRAAYADGKMTSEGARPTAGVPGTTICIENLFYNVPTRRRALKSASEEFARVLETTQRYAASRPDVAFCVRKLGDARPALRCPAVPSFTFGSGFGSLENLLKIRDTTRDTRDEPSSSNARLHRLRAVYGDTTAKCLAPLFFSAGGWTPNNESALEHESSDTSTIRFAVDALVSTPEYRSKKTTFVLFINERLVECFALRRACENAYASLLPKSERPFVFVSLRLPRETVDVNVHPTKREVRFLHQDEIVDAIAQGLVGVLERNNDARTFAARVVSNEGEIIEGEKTAPLHGDEKETDTPKRAKFSKPLLDSPTDPDSQFGRKRPKTTTRDLVARDHKLVRVDANQAAGSLDAFFHRKTKTPSTNNTPLDDASDPPARAVREAAGSETVSDVVCERDGAVGPVKEGEKKSGPSTSRPEPAEPERAEALAFATAAAAADGETSPLSSVRELWGEIKTHAHAGLTRMARNMVLVGPCDVNDPCGLWLVQHATKLHAISFHKMAREFFSQRVVARFGAHAIARLAESAPIGELIAMALWSEMVEDDDDENDDDENENDDDEKKNATFVDDPRVARAADAARALLAEKAPMLREYFGVDIDEASGSLLGLPVLVEGFEPDLSLLPEFVFALAHEVDWTEEKACFRTVADALATFYAGGSGDPGEGHVTSSTRDEFVENAPAAEDDEPERVRSIRQFVFPAMRRCLHPSKVSAVQGVATQVASLEQLYRVFERC